MKVKVNLDTFSDVVKFVSITSSIKEPVYLTGHGFKVSAQSLLGAHLASVEWDEVWCESEADIYMKIEEFVVIE